MEYVERRKTTPYSCKLRRSAVVVSMCSKGLQRSVVCVSTAIGSFGAIESFGGRVIISFAALLRKNAFRVSRRATERAIGKNRMVRYGKLREHIHIHCNLIMECTRTEFGKGFRLCAAVDRHFCVGVCVRAYSGLARVGQSRKFVAFATLLSFTCLPIPPRWAFPSIGIGNESRKSSRARKDKDTGRT